MDIRLWNNNFSNFQTCTGYPRTLWEEAGASQQLVHGAQRDHAAAGGPGEGAHQVRVSGRNGIRVQEEKNGASFLNRIVIVDLVSSDNLLG